MDNGDLRMRKESPLELVFFERLEGRGTGAQGVVFGNPIEDVNSPVVQQRGLRDCPPGWLWADGTALERFVGDFLDCLESVTISAFVFVQRHDSWVP